MPICRMSTTMTFTKRSEHHASIPSQSSTKAFNPRSTQGHHISISVNSSFSTQTYVNRKGESTNQLH